MLGRAEGCAVHQPHRADPSRCHEGGELFVFMAVPPGPGTEPGTPQWVLTAYSLNRYKAFGGNRKQRSTQTLIQTQTSQTSCAILNSFRVFCLNLCCHICKTGIVIFPNTANSHRIVMIREIINTIHYFNDNKHLTLQVFLLKSFLN